jgi:hypothetical protein
MYYVHCKKVNNLLVPVHYELIEEGKDRLGKQSDMVTGALDLDKHDCNLFYNIYTGSDEDGSTDGIIEHKRYYIVRANGEIEGSYMAYLDGIEQKEPEAPAGMFVTAAIHATNKERKSHKLIGVTASGRTHAFEDHIPDIPQSSGFSVMGPK